MGQAVALKVAIDLLHFPARARSMRADPLPDGVSDLICIVAGDRDAVELAARTVGRSQDVVREAAEFYAEQILLYPGADSYRVLGAEPDASYEELRRNMAHLLRWLHPDGGRHGAREVFASRVTKAWDDLRSKDRRDAYDRSPRRAASERVRSPSSRPGGTRQKPARRKRHPRLPMTPVRMDNRREFSDPIFLKHGAGLFRRLLRLLFGRV